MKKTTLNIAFLALAVLTIFSFGFTNSNSGKLDKITICHVPPGNPDNCHEITISMNAFQTHVDHHGDALVCHSRAELPAYQEIGTYYQMAVRTAF